MIRNNNYNYIYYNFWLSIVENVSGWVRKETHPNFVLKIDKK